MVIFFACCFAAQDGCTPVFFQSFPFTTAAARVGSESGGAPARDASLLLLLLVTGPGLPLVRPTSPPPFATLALLLVPSLLSLLRIFATGLVVAAAASRSSTGRYIIKLGSLSSLLRRLDPALSAIYSLIPPSLPAPRLMCSFSSLNRIALLALRLAWLRKLLLSFTMSAVPDDFLDFSSSSKLEISSESTKTALVPSTFFLFPKRLALRVVPLFCCCFSAVRSSSMRSALFFSMLDVILD
mmetsp:Transcript_7241/g.12037  ORF Transcript_7241/g.12037 Transcript_7241/m.12037 type:complete len:241 (+) Transcript_7241:1678-2400(+)